MQVDAPILSQLFEQSNIIASSKLEVIFLRKLKLAQMCSLGWLPKEKSRLQSLLKLWAISTAMGIAELLSKDEKGLYLCADSTANKAQMSLLNKCYRHPYSLSFGGVTHTWEVSISQGSLDGRYVSLILLTVRAILRWLNIDPNEKHTFISPTSRAGPIRFGALGKFKIWGPCILFMKHFKNIALSHLKVKHNFLSKSSV